VPTEQNVRDLFCMANNNDVTESQSHVGCFFPFSVELVQHPAVTPILLIRVDLWRAYYKTIFVPKLAAIG